MNDMFDKKLKWKTLYDIKTELNNVDNKLTYRELAKKYNVSIATISRIKNKKIKTIDYLNYENKQKEIEEKNKIDLENKQKEIEKLNDNLHQIQLQLQEEIQNLEEKNIELNTQILLSEEEELREENINLKQNNQILIQDLEKMKVDKENIENKLRISEFNNNKYNSLYNSYKALELQNDTLKANYKSLENNSCQESYNLRIEISKLQNKSNDLNIENNNLKRQINDLKIKQQNTLQNNKNVLQEQICTKKDDIDNNEFEFDKFLLMQELSNISENTNDVNSNLKLMDFL